MRVSVSTMPVGDDIEKLKKYVKEIEFFADFLHCDICDGKYNQTKCFSPQMACEINKITTLPLDCHLMTKNAIERAKEYIKSGANFVTAQLESFDSQTEILNFIDYTKKHKSLAGLAIEPETEIEQILPFVEQLDIILVMSVKTGASGQKFDENVLSKIEYLSNVKKHKNCNFLIEVDGGINDKNIKDISLLGADIVVSGNHIYNAVNKKDAIDFLKTQY